MDKQIRWLVGGQVATADGLINAAVGIAGCRIRAIRTSAPAGGERISVRGCIVAPGFVDLHLWGNPRQVAAEAARTGTTAFLSAIEPCAPEELVSRLEALGPIPRADVRPDQMRVTGAVCLGAHLEGPFLNAVMGGSLPRRWMRSVEKKELRQLAPWASRIRLVTIAPEVPGALAAIAWGAERGIVMSLGHTAADYDTARRAVEAGATIVTHLFNGMRPFHHRQPGMLGQALLDDRLSAMMILDGVHVGPAAFALALRCKGVNRMVLVTDSIRHGAPMAARRRGGAFYTPEGVLAGSALTMIDALRQAMASGKIRLEDAIRMASENPARLLGETHQRGSLAPGHLADVTVFDRSFRVRMVFVNGTVAYAH